MKIIKLEFEAFGPFLKRQVIDFTRLNDKGVYLIDGETGIGKTTIFDAIVFALYGSASGQDRKDSSNLRSEYATSDIETFVELTFEANGKTYKIRRSPSYIRMAKKGGDKLTSENASATLYLPDNTSLNKITEINEKIQNEILLISKDQFKQIALLAQGEFTKLITASSDERGKILEHIFDKNIYNEIIANLKDKTSKAKTFFDEKSSYLQGLISQVSNKENITGFEEAYQDRTFTPTFLNNLKEYLSVLKAENEALKSLLETIESDKNNDSKNLIDAKRDNEIISNYINAKKIFDELDSKKEEFILKQKEFDIISELDILRGYIENKKNFEQIKDFYNNNLKEIEESIKLYEAECVNLKNKEEHIDTIKTETKNLELKKNLLDEINSAKSVLISLNNELKNKENDLCIAKADLDQTESFLKETRDAYLSSISANIAKNLEEGKPCPVCGSLEHPKKATSINLVSENDFKNAEEKYKEKDLIVKKVTGEFTELSTKYKTNINSLKIKLKEFGFEDTEDFIFSNKLNDAIKDVIDRLNVANKEIADFNGKITKNNEDLTEAKGNKNSLLSSIAKNQSELSKANEIIISKFNLNKLIKNEDDYNKYNDIYCDFDKDTIAKYIADYNTSLVKNKAIIDNTKESLRVNEVKEIACLDEKLKTSEDLFREKTDKFALNSHTITSLENSYKSIEEEFKKYENAGHRYSLINALYDNLRGENTSKLSFRMYILISYFGKIIEAANMRFNKISNGRYRFVRSKEYKKAGLQHGLDLNVYDIETGKERPAADLSGGEKFIAALSLALGLSDIVESSGGLVKIDSIFIDEGFGSLSDNFIDTALDALSSLENENKSVAIISHVEKLKDRLKFGLNVEKDHIGSTIKYREI